MTDALSLEQRLELAQARIAWRPVDGESIAGTVLSIAQRESNYGGTYPLLTIHEHDGRVLDVHAYEAVLLSELAKLCPRVGERIGIAYLGKHPERGYHRFRVLVDRETQSSIDWSRYGEQAASELAAEDASSTPEAFVNEHDLVELRATFRRSGWTTERLADALKELGLSATPDVGSAMRRLTSAQAVKLAKSMVSSGAGQ